jgi:hypothetical protein
VASVGLPSASFPEAVTFWVVLVTWIGGEVWLQQRRQLPTSAANQDAGSMHLLITSVWAAVGIGMASSFLL